MRLFLTSDELVALDYLLALAIEDDKLRTPGVLGAAGKVKEAIREMTFREEDRERDPDDIVGPRDSTRKVLGA